MSVINRCSYKSIASIALAFACGIVATIVVLSILDREPQPNRLANKDSATRVDSVSATQSRPEIAELSVSRATSDYEYFAALYGNLHSASNDELSAMLSASQHIPNPSRRQETQVAIVRRMASQDPKTALKNTRELPGTDNLRLTKIVFEEWSVKNFEQALRHAKTLNRDLRKSALRGFISSLHQLVDDDIKDLAQELDLQNNLVELMTDPKYAAEIDKPELAWNEILADDTPEAAQLSELLAVGESWINQNGLAVLEHMNNSLNVWEIKYAVTNALLYHVAAEDLQEAFDLALNLSENYDHMFLTSIVESWALKDPDGALQAISALEKEGVRRNMRYTLVHAWARSSPSTLLANLDTLPESFRVVGQENALRSLAETAPKAVLDYLPSLSNDNSLPGILYAVAESWSRIDPVEALNWVQNDSLANEMKSNLLNPILSRLSETDPDLAMDTALKQPLIEGHHGHEGAVISAIAWRDVQLARKLLPRVRAGQTKFMALDSIGSALISHGEFLQAYDLGSGLTGQESWHFYRNITSHWSRNAPTELFHKLSELDSAELQSMAAYFLIEANPWQRALTDGQLEEAAKFLTTEHREELKKRERYE